MIRKIVESLTQKDVRVHGFFDFGRAAYATLEVELETTFPENLEIVVGEVAQEGRIVHAPGFRTFLQQIVQTGIGHQVIRFRIPDYIQAYGDPEYRPRPVEADGEIAPFRYAEVNRHYGEVTVRRTAYYPEWDDHAALFESDNPALNEVWEFCRYSIKAASVFDCYVDGERERMPYEGDAVINQLGHFCCETHYDTARRTIDWFCGGGRDSWLTEWILSTPRLIQDYLLYSGDTASVKRWLPFLDAKLLPGCRNGSGLLDSLFYAPERPGAHRFADLVDWPPSECDSYERSECSFVPNAMLYRALEIAAELTGEARYRKEAQSVRREIRARFLKNGLFVDSPDSCHTALHTAMFALVFDLAEGEEAAAHKAIIADRGMACSVYGAQYLLEACFKHGMAEHALRLLTSDSDRSWRGMIRDGTTISAESWNERCKPNLDWTHAWGAAPANIVTRWLCGIRPTQPGFASFMVDPQPGSLNWFHVVQPTLHGPVELEWKKGKMRLAVPEGSCAHRNGLNYGPGVHRIDASQG